MPNRDWVCRGRLPNGERCGALLALRRGDHAIVPTGHGRYLATRTDGAKLIVCDRCREKRAWRGEVVIR